MKPENLPITDTAVAVICAYPFADEPGKPGFSFGFGYELSRIMEEQMWRELIEKAARRLEQIEREDGCDEQEVQK